VEQNTVIIDINQKFVVKGIIFKRVGFEAFTAVVMKSIIFWDMTPCSPLSFNRRFGGTYRLHLQGRRNKFSKKSADKQNTMLAGKPDIYIYKYIYL
jgi:hypothetical protein